MRFSNLPALFLASLAVILCTGKAVASCEGMVMLGALHDAYLATLKGPVEDRERAAMALLVITGDRDGATLARQASRSGIELDGSRLSLAMENARNLAARTLAGTRPDELVFRHGLDIDWLGDIFAASGCRNSAPTTSLTPSAPDRMAQTRRDTSALETTAKTRTLTVLFTVTATAILVAIVAHRISRSAFLRSRRAERMPRFPISLPLHLTYTDPEGHIRETDVEASDISRGGLKLSWLNPPPTGTLVTLPILGSERLGHVVWANAYYAGIVLEAQLTKQEIDTLKELHQTA